MIISQTPLRVSFLGGGTDFPAYYAAPGNPRGGAVTGVAIDKLVYVIVKQRFDDRIYLNYSRKEIVDSVDELQHGLVREAMRLTGVKSGVEITTLADVPSEGSGLGSSSAITVGLLNALWAYQGESFTAGELAAQANRIELDILRRPMGVQDAYLAALGGIRHVTFGPRDATAVRWERVDLPREDVTRLCANLMLFYTNKTRNSSTILAAQSANIADRTVVLDALRELADEGARRLAASDFDAFGALLHEGWMLKTRLADGISDVVVDELYARARAAGAVGGKIAGAGGGGFLLLYVPLAAQDAVRSAIRSDLREMPFRFERDGTRIVFNMRRDPYY
jgi:D-glycero-alpha-D-manno-heptose-7-phosphate kinase